MDFVEGKHTVVLGSVPKEGGRKSSRGGYGGRGEVDLTVLWDTSLCVQAVGVKEIRP